MAEIMTYITAPNMDEAERIGKKLVEERLVACVNILPGMRSIYQWQGEIESAEEVVVIAKTRKELADRMTARIEELHPYDVPCAVWTEIQGGNAPFLEWIQAETGGDG